MIHTLRHIVGSILVGIGDVILPAEEQYPAFKSNTELDDVIPASESGLRKLGL